MSNNKPFRIKGVGIALTFRRQLQSEELLHYKSNAEGMHFGPANGDTHRMYGQISTLNCGVPWITNAYTYLTPDPNIATFASLQDVRPIYIGKYSIDINDELRSLHQCWHCILDIRKQLGLYRGKFEMAAVGAVKDRTSAIMSNLEALTASQLDAAAKELVAFYKSVEIEVF